MDTTVSVSNISTMTQMDVKDDEKSRDSLSTDIPGTIASQSPKAAVIATSLGETSWTTILCHCITCCNCCLLIALVALVVFETNKVQTLQKTVDQDKLSISALQDEVRDKQENKIEQLHQEVQQEHDLTFLTLAGIFTLLTCLISMFHMSSHLQKMNQPIIQRKIVAILWMSPVYSVTSFLTLIYPPIEGYMAIIKDFYESYCIYIFLSFLIVVLGQGSRQNAVEVLAMHAQHLQQPTRLLSRWYDPPPETSDVAKANAVITECQIFAMQFVFIRPLTTVMYVIYHAINDPEGDTYRSYSGGNGTGNRWLRWLQSGGALGANNTESNIIDVLSPTATPAFAPTLTPGYIAEPFPTMAPVGTSMPDSSQGDFSEATKAYFKSFGFVLAMIVNVSVFFAFTGLLKFYHSVHKDLAWCRPWPKFLTIKGVVFSTFWQGCVILIATNLNGNIGKDESLDEDPSTRGRRIQNILICCEMLFFSLTHWCVFPAEEWENGYEPPTQVNQPGIGFQDFVSDVGQIYRRRRKVRRRPTRSLPGGKRWSPRRSDGDGLYHRPGTASEMSATASTYAGEDELESSESNNNRDEDFEVQRRSSPRSATYHQPGTATRLSHAGIPEEDDFVQQRPSPRSRQPLSTTRLSHGGAFGDEEESSESNHYPHDDDGGLMFVEMNASQPVLREPPAMSRESWQGRPRLMSEGSSVKADDEDDEMELI